MGQPWDGGYGTPPTGDGYGGYGAPPTGGGYGPGGQPPGGYGGGYGYGPIGSGPDPSAKTMAIVLLIANILGLFCCCPAAIGGIIVAIIGLTKADTDGELTRKLNIWAWVAIGVELLALVVTVVLYAIGIFHGVQESSSY